MPMDEPVKDRNEPVSDGPPMSHLDPRRFSSVTPPPMQVVYKGWWNYKTSLRQAADLEREDWEARRLGKTPR